MSEKYTPRVGDKVRATLGENVTVGECTFSEDGYACDILPELSENPQAHYVADGWQFEQIVSVPSKFGAVIRRADGALFVRDNDPKAPWLSLDGSGSGATDDTATAGGFTVLFEGVDK